MYRPSIPLFEEVRDILIADVALAVAFAILLSGVNSAGLPPMCRLASGVLGLLCKSSFLFYLPISFVAVSLTFILHEYMHKVVAEHYGAVAAFRRSDIGILIAIATSLLGFLMALPGATMIYATSFTKEQDGYTSLAGPLTNFAIFAIFFGIAAVSGISLTLQPTSYMGYVIVVTVFIALWLAFVNMLPVFPLDGSKVLRWNKIVYVIVIAMLFALLYIFEGGASILFSMVIVFILSLFISVFSRGILFG